jgi:hypothetical protein
MSEVENLIQFIAEEFVAALTNSSVSCWNPKSRKKRSRWQGPQSGNHQTIGVSNQLASLLRFLNHSQCSVAHTPGEQITKVKLRPMPAVETHLPS